MTLRRKTSWLFLEWAGTTVFGALPDIRFINRFLARAFYFFMNHHRVPDLSNPRHFNEKLINIKTSDESRDPLRRRVTDKEFVKAHVTDVCGPGHVAPTLAILRAARDIDAFEFPLPCVVKPTHSSQEVMLLDKNQPTNEERRRLKYWLRKDYFAASREPNYRGLERKLIVEPIIGGVFGAVDDIKVMCFFGEPKLIHVDRGRYSEHRRDYYDVEGRFLPVELKYPSCAEAFPFPQQLPELLEISRKLSAPFRFIRVDFYVCDGTILVGELTSFPSNCVHPFRPPEADLVIARALDEPDVVISPELFDGLPAPRNAAAPAAALPGRPIAAPSGPVPGGFHDPAGPARRSGP